MDHKDIRKLANLMNETGLTSLEYRSQGESVKLRRAVVADAMPQADIRPAATHVEPKQSGQPSGGGSIVKSPMVGVFYCAPGPDKEPFVSVGDSVHAGDILCIIEAMKIMNEITAEQAGVVAEVLAGDKEVVEFGQPLFRIT